MVDAVLTLAAALADPRLHPLDRARVRDALAFRWCWPSGAMADAAFALASPAAPPTPGTAPAVAIGAGGASLWELRVGGGAVPLHGDAKNAARAAWGATVRGLPALGRPESLAGLAAGSAPDIAGASVCKGEPVQMLEGRSFGLSLTLAFASHLLGVPVAPDQLATAQVDVDGRLSSVDGLREKLACIAGWALGVRAVLVAREQRDEAAAIVADAGFPLRILGVSSVAEAFSLAFPTLVDDLAARWRTPEQRSEAARALFFLACKGSRTLLRWDCVAAVAELIEPTDPLCAWYLATARAIAGRHEGQPLLVPTVPAGVSLPLGLRLRIAAHRVQASADAIDPGWESVLADARRWLPSPGDELPDHLRLLGAIGRCLAAWGRIGEARGALDRAVDGWLALDQPVDASFPLCELVRVTGFSGSNALDARAQVVFRDPRVDEVSRAYLAIAIGRFFVQRRSPEATAILADDRLFWSAPGHVQGARARWLAILGGAPERAPAGLERWLAGMAVNAEIDAVPPDAEAERELTRIAEWTGLSGAALASRAAEVWRY